MKREQRTTHVPNDNNAGHIGYEERLKNSACCKKKKIEGIKREQRTARVQKQIRNNSGHEGRKQITQP